MISIPFKSPFLPENPKIVGVQEGYDLWSEFYDDESNVLIHLEQQHLYPRLCQRNYQSIFDCGCGTGRIAIFLRHHFPDSTMSVPTSQKDAQPQETKARIKESPA